MKKILKSLMFMFVGVFALLLTSCEKHTPTVGWVRDSTAHWHACADEDCQEPVDYELHVYNNWVKDNADCFETRKCDICGFVLKRDVAHEWGNWATQKDGTFGRKCGHCGKVESLAQYYVKGAIAGNSGIVWDKSDAGKFAIDTETMTASITLELAVGDQFKVGTASGWEFNAGNMTLPTGLEGSDNVECKVAGTYKVVISELTGNSHKCTVTKL